MGSLSLVTAPVGEPISLQEAKEHCRIDLDNEDALIGGYIAAARQHVENVTARQLLTAVWALKLDGWPCWIDVPRPPLQSVSGVPVVAITYVDADGATQTLATTDYRVDAPSGPTCERGRIEPAYGVSWPSLRGVLNSVTVTFSAGYGATGDTVPMALRQAMLLAIAHWYRNREHVVTDTNAIELPLTVKELLRPFKTRALLVA
jgi:uncharacterized phiE125 gp8 family phage protein